MSQAAMSTRCGALWNRTGRMLRGPMVSLAVRTAPRLRTAVWNHRHASAVRRTDEPRRKSKQEAINRRNRYDFQAGQLLTFDRAPLRPIFSPTGYTILLIKSPLSPSKVI